MLIQEDYFKNIFNTVRGAILILDGNLRVLSANNSFFTIFKVDASNTIGSLLYDLGNGQWNIPHLRVLLEDVLPKNDTVDDYEIVHDFESIGVKTMLLNARKILENNRDLPIILLAIEDITARKELEAGLEKTRKELEVIKQSADEAHEFADNVINTVHEPLISLDQDLRVVTVNRSFYEFFKVRPEETVGQLIYDLGNKQWDIPKLRELLETILPQKTSFDNYEVEHDFSTIGRRIMLLNARQIQRALGKEQIILLAIEDITERKQVEETLNRSVTELKRSNDELQQFAYVASHDLQEPLRMVASFTQLLAERYDNQLDDKGKKFIQYAVDGAVRMQLLINDLLAYSRIGTKAKPLETIDLNTVLGEVINNLKINIDEAKAIITNEELPEVRADASQLVQLFQNLIGNAVKFRGTGLPHIHLSARDEGREWRFSVRDSGIGIDPQYADKVFTIFQRLHTREEYPGSGIGLAICKKIVERHGGRIWFESELGKGTTFFFTISK
jgi:PAS domain S-box-containing protein